MKLIPILVPAMACVVYALHARWHPGSALGYWVTPCAVGVIKSVLVRPSETKRTRLLLLMMYVRVSLSDLLECLSFADIEQLNDLMAQA